MARRELEKAIQVEQNIQQLHQQGKEWPEKFTKIQITKEIQLKHEYESVFSLQYSFDGEKLAVGCGSGAIVLYNAKTGDFIRELRKPRYGGMQIMCLRFHPKYHNKLLATTSDGKVYFINTDEDQDVSEEIILEKSKGEPNQINCMDFSLDGFEFVTVGKDLNVRKYDAKTFELLHCWEGYNSSSNPNEVTSAGMRLFSVKWHPLNNDIFITGGWENHLKIWDARGNKEPVRRVIHGPHICGDSLDVKETRPNHTSILTGSWTALRSLQIWDYTSGQVEKEIPFDISGHQGAYLYCAQFCDNNTVIAGGSGTNSVQAIDYGADKVIGEIKFEKPVQALDTVKGGRLFAVGTEDNKLVFAGLG